MKVILSGMENKTEITDLKIDPKEIIENLPFYEKQEDFTLYIEKKLPYLIVCRSAGEKSKKLIANEPAFIWAEPQVSVEGLVQDLSERLSDEFGAFLLLEFWINDKNLNTFKLMFPEGKAPATIEKVQEGFLHLRKHFPNIRVEQHPVDKRCPEEHEEFYSKQEYKKAGILKLGIEIPNFFTDPITGKGLPVFFRNFREHFSTTIKRGIYEFIRVQTNLGLNDYKLLGRKILNKHVWQVDKALTEIEKQFEFLLLIAPANSDESWDEFKKSNYNINPNFHYRLLPVDPDKLKKRLYSIDIDAVDDPSVAYLFREKREELDTLITMINERNSTQFLHSSIRLFKYIDEPLLHTAREILRKVDPVQNTGNEIATEHDFAAAAKEEIAYYHKQNPEFIAPVEMRNDMVGIMVSQGRLYVGKNFVTSKKRVNPLLQHEVGTHVLTYFNGSNQPLQLMRTGLAGYDELQEGIAVLSEYLVGGLTTYRLRILAARVTAAQDMIDGAEFKDVYNQLVNEHSFNPSTAYELVTRIYQSGGYTKDIIYLRGLVRLMNYLQEGGDMDVMFLGKIADKHVPIVSELLDRQVLKPAALTPRYMKDPECLKRLDKVKNGASLLDLLN